MPLRYALRDIRDIRSCEGRRTTGILPEDSGKIVMQVDALLLQFRTLNIWHQGAQRAPHKPLLVLLSLGRIQAGRDRLVPFAELAPALDRLLREFGPPRCSVHPEYPFWRLQHDKVWELDGPIDELRRRQSNTDPLKSELLRAGIAGGFPAVIYETLARSPELLHKLGRELLSGHFPDSLHSSICTAVGLDLTGTTRNTQDDPGFRHQVVTAWAHECAFCGFSVQLDNVDLGLEAAHIQWVKAGGPETLDNGIACCAIHHLAFDRGALGITDDLHIIVSDRLQGHGKIEELFLALGGASVRSPLSTLARPNRHYLRWHRREVFRGRPCTPPK